jgi:hypothetical protein
MLLIPAHQLNSEVARDRHAPLSRPSLSANGAQSGDLENLLRFSNLRHTLGCYKYDGDVARPGS